MAKIKWSTTYDQVRQNKGDGNTQSFTGEFLLIKVRGELFYHESTKGWLIPLSQVSYSRVTGGDAGP